MTKELLVEFIERLTRIENERRILEDDRKELFAEYKEKLDIKAVRAAIQIAKIRSKLGDSEHTMDSIFETVEKHIFD